MAWLTQTQLGKFYNLSASTIGQFLIQANLREGKEPTDWAKSNGYCLERPGVGFTYWVWDEYKVKKVLQQQYEEFLEDERRELLSKALREYVSLSSRYEYPPTPVQQQKLLQWDEDVAAKRVDPAEKNTADAEDFFARLEAEKNTADAEDFFARLEAGEIDKPKPKSSKDKNIIQSGPNKGMTRQELGRKVFNAAKTNKATREKAIEEVDGIFKLMTGDERPDYWRLREKYTDREAPEDYEWCRIIHAIQKSKGTTEAIRQECDLAVLRAKSYFVGIYARLKSLVKEIEDLGEESE